MMRHELELSKASQMLWMIDSMICFYLGMKEQTNRFYTIRKRWRWCSRKAIKALDDGNRCLKLDH